MSKITLNDLVNLQNETSAVTIINGNNQTLETAFDNTLSRDGTSPNTMGASIDMNSNPILNLPTATTNAEPVTLAQLNAVTVAAGNVPAGGTTGQKLTKNSNTSFDFGWASETNMAAFTLKGNSTGSAAAPADISIPALTSKATPIGADSVMIVDSAASNALKRATLTSIQGVSAVTSIAGNTGAFTLSTGLTNSTNDLRINAGSIPAVATSGLATAGTLGEYISSQVLIAGETPATATATPVNITSISLTAGDWDVDGVVYSDNAGACTLLVSEAWISSTSATVPTRPNNGMMTMWVGSTTSNIAVSAGSGRISLASTTTIFLSCYANFTGGSSNPKYYGFIGARRAR